MMEKIRSVLTQLSLKINSLNKNEQKLVIVVIFAISLLFSDQIIITPITQEVDLLTQRVEDRTQVLNSNLTILQVAEQELAEKKGLPQQAELLKITKQIEELNTQINQNNQTLLNRPSAMQAVQKIIASSNGTLNNLRIESLQGSSQQDLNEFIIKAEFSTESFSDISKLLRQIEELPKGLKFEGIQIYRQSPSGLYIVALAFKAITADTQLLGTNNL